MTGELAFFELGVEDADKGRAFYEGVFGWGFERGPSGQGWVISAPNVRGGMHPGDRGASPYVFFAVDDIDAAVRRVRELGGEAADAEPAKAGERGRYTSCRDDQGVVFGLHEPG